MIAGVCLITIPAKNETIDSNVHAAATEVIDGVTYEVITLTSDSAANMSKINAHQSGDTGNYRYVMTGNWDLVANKAAPFFYGDKVIFDFNGYKLTATTASNGGYLLRFLSTTTTELTDSGKVGQWVSPVVVKSSTLILSGNVNIGYLEVTVPNIIVRGLTYAYVPTSTSTFTVAPYITRDENNYFRPLCSYYTVSTRSDIVSGVYNYEFSYASELTVGELSKLAVPADKTYYLWGRNADGEYVCLNIVYRDGEWRTAA